MSTVWASLLAATWLLAVAEMPLPTAAESSAPTLVEFKIKDQFGEVYTDEPYREGLFVVIGSDREGSEFSRGWTEAVRESLEGLTAAVDVHFAAVAHVHGVPRLIRGMVRGAFPDHPDAWVLLDWKGVFEEAYGYEPDSTTVLVFLDSAMIYRTHGREVEPDRVEALRSAVEEALTAPPSEAVAAVGDDL